MQDAAFFAVVAKSARGEFFDEAPSGTSVRSWASAFHHMQLLPPPAVASIRLHRKSLAESSRRGARPLSRTEFAGEATAGAEAPAIRGTCFAGVKSRRSIRDSGNAEPRASTT